MTKMKKIVSHLIYFLMILSSSASAESPTPPLKLSHPGDKQVWLATMQKDLPAVLCKDDHYFVKCFDTTPQECMEVSSLYVKACLNNITIALPQELNDEKGEYWGQMVGRCTYDLYEKFMSAKKRDLPECKENASSNDDLPKPSQAIP